MLNVLHVISGIDLRKGGTAKAAIDLTRAQAAAGLGVTLLSSFTAGEDVAATAASLRESGVKVELVGPVAGRLQSHPAMRTTVDRCVAAADIVHIHAMWESIQHHAAVAARATRRPYVWMPHGMLDPWSLAQSKLKKRLMLMWRTRRDLRGAAAVAFTTQVERDLVEPLKLNRPAIVEPLGVDWSEFDVLPSAEEFLAKFPALRGKRIVLFLSRVHPKKGLDLLIPAFARVAAADDRLVIAGPIADGYAATIDRLIDEQGVRDRVLLPGMLFGRDRIAAMAAATIFVLPSYQENFGIAVAEALAAGCPAIISDQVNIWKELHAARAAGVVPTQLEPLTAMMREWLANDELRRGFAERGQAFARQHFDWPAIARRWVDHYAAVYNGGYTKAGAAQ